MVLPHPLLVLQPPVLGWGWAHGHAGAGGSAAQPVSFSPDGIAFVHIVGDTQPRALTGFDFCFFQEDRGCWAGEDPLWDRFTGM